MGYLVLGLLFLLVLGPLPLLWYLRRGTRARQRAVRAFVRTSQAGRFDGLKLSASSTDEWTHESGVDRWAGLASLHRRAS